MIRLGNDNLKICEKARMSIILRNMFAHMVFWNTDVDKIIKNVNIKPNNKTILIHKKIEIKKKIIK